MVEFQTLAVFEPIKMSTLLATRYDFIGKLPAGSTLQLSGLSWDDYEELLDSVGESRGFRIWYDAGRLQIMTLSPDHEKYKDLLHDMVRSVSLRLRRKMFSLGSVTMKKPGDMKGVEPDYCFYVQTASAIENKPRIDFTTDPPPDVVVEVDLQHDSLSKFPIYAAFGVPEIWRYDAQSLTIYHLEAGSYAIKPASQALPVLTADVLSEFLSRNQIEGQYETLLAFEEWLGSQQV